MFSNKFKVLFREFFFRIVDVEFLAKDAKGDSRGLLGQLASLLLFCSLLLGIVGALWGSGSQPEGIPAVYRLSAAWTMQHFLISTTMLVAGLFSVLSWESMLIDRRDLVVLGHLPIPRRTLILSKLAATGAAVVMTVVSLHSVAGLVWPFAFSRLEVKPTPSLLFDAALPPASAANFKPVLDRDMAPLLPFVNRMTTDGKAGIVIGVSIRGAHRVVSYGSARPNSIFEIGSITKTFTGLLLAEMATHREVTLREPVRDLLSSSIPSGGNGFDISLLDLATHHSGLPPMPDNAGPPDQAESYTKYDDDELREYLQVHGLRRSSNPGFRYSNLGFAVLGAALANRAGKSYADLLRTQITVPLEMGDTSIGFSPDQRQRLLVGHDGRGQPTPPWDLQALASAGGIRSSVPDMLKYLDAQLKPAQTPLAGALKTSQIIRDRIGGRLGISLAWSYDLQTRTYEQDGATGGFSSFAFFDPHDQIASVGFVNAGPTNFPLIGVLSEHIRERLAGEPAIALAPVTVKPAGPLHSFVAYWLTMFIIAVFTFSLVLGIQGIASYLLPHAWFLRLSTFLQVLIFGALVTGYFLQRSPLSVLLDQSGRSWRSYVPTYWFVGLYEQLSGALHPGLACFASRAWLSLLATLSLAVVAYLAAYYRGMRRILETAEIPPAHRVGWLPSVPNRSIEIAIVQFCVHTLLRSRRHRLIFAFYAGVGFAFAVLFLSAPEEISGVAGKSAWSPASIPLLASTMLVTGSWIVGLRSIFSLPVQLPASWAFRMMPFSSGKQCLGARRCALLLLGVLPPWSLSTILLLTIWPVHVALAHASALGLIGLIFAEFSWDSVQRVPFACSYLPGKSNLHLAFWFWLYVALGGSVGAATEEQAILRSAPAISCLLVSLALVVLFFVIRNHRAAEDPFTELRFEEVPEDKVVTLDLV